MDSDNVHHAQSTFQGLRESVYLLDSKVVKVREKIAQWMDTMAYSNTALCELSTAMTDLTSLVSFEGSLGPESSRMMKTTNAALCELSTAMTGDWPFTNVARSGTVCIPHDSFQAVCLT